MDSGKCSLSHECMKQFKVDFRIPPHKSKVKSQVNPGPEPVIINNINQNMNIIIFIQSGGGNTTTGQTARVFFGHKELRESLLVLVPDESKEGVRIMMQNIAVILRLVLPLIQIFTLDTHSARAAQYIIAGVIALCNPSFLC